MNFHQIISTSTDYNDCTVIAVSTITGISCEKVHEALLSAGRGYGTGLRADILSEFLRENGFTLMPDCNLSLKWALLKCHTGKYLFLVHKHIFCVIDGVVHDTSEPNSKQKVVRIYQYEKC